MNGKNIINKTKFIINTRVPYSMQQLSEIFNKDKKIIFNKIDISNFTIEGKSFFSGKNKPLTPMILGTLNYTTSETKIIFSIKICNLGGWIAITLIALVFFWKSFLGMGVWQIVIPWVFNVTYYFFKKRNLIKKIYTVFEKQIDL
jgi:hypothetical protein